MQPWKIIVGLTAIVLALAVMLAGKSFAYLKPYFRIILTDYWMPIAWYGGPRCELSTGCSVKGVVHPSLFGKADWKIKPSAPKGEPEWTSTTMP